MIDREERNKKLDYYCTRCLRMWVCLHLFSRYPSILMLFPQTTLTNPPSFSRFLPRKIDSDPKEKLAFGRSLRLAQTTERCIWTSGVYLGL